MSPAADATRSRVADVHRLLPAMLAGWAALSVVVALLPPGVGGLARVLNTVVFLGLGPGCALASLLATRLPRAVLPVLALATSLTVLLLSSQVLLALGIWAAWRVSAFVGAATIAVAIVQVRTATQEEV